MTPERWQHVKELFGAAQQQTPGERAAFIAGACGGDESLRSEVESLLAAHEQDESFMERPAVAATAVAEALVGAQGKLASGQRVGHYEIVTLLGAGGMGEVYLAEDMKLGRKVALKLLPAYFTRDGERLRRFEQEARATSALNHPNILTIYEISQVDGRHYIATEYIDGLTLREHMQGSDLKLGDALDIAIQVANALAAAHAAGIIHRDIKPENIMLRHDRIVKVLDFGLVKL